MKKYGVRYLVEPWNKPPENVEEKAVIPGVRPSKDSYGYCDSILVASILLDGDGDIDSILILSDENGGPSRRRLELVRDQINHQLEHHAENNR